MRVKVYVSLKKAILDPQGKAVENALPSLGYDNVSGVRVGKFMTMDVAGDDPEKARAEIDEMCTRLLSNPVIEDYRYEIEAD